jgi:hypothetical protein
MARRTTLHHQDNASTAPGVAPGHLFTLPEWCRRTRISLRAYYNLAEQGQAPKVLRIGRRVLISPEEDAAWRERMTYASQVMARAS